MKYLRRSCLILFLFLHQFGSKLLNVFLPLFQAIKKKSIQASYPSYAWTFDFTNPWAVPQGSFASVRYQDDEEKECESGFDPDIGECCHFYRQCVHFKWHETDCQSGTVWDKTISGCNYPAAVPGCSNGAWKTGNMYISYY